MIGKISGQVLLEMYQLEILQVTKEQEEEFLEQLKLLPNKPLDRQGQALDKD